MGAFDFLRNKKEMTLVAPVSGECIPITRVPDPVFAEEIVGKGIAIKPKEGKFYAPASGKVTTVFTTGHAVGITTREGLELLIHIGIDTVALNGQFFYLRVEQGQEVKKGDLLVEAELPKIEEAGYDTVTPIVICNSSEFSKMVYRTEGNVTAGDTIITYMK